jgi:hypothetical protein
MMLMQLGLNAFLLSRSGLNQIFDLKWKLCSLLPRAEFIKLEAVCKETLRTSSPFASPFSEFSQHQAN